MRIPTLAGMTRGAAGALLFVALLLPAAYTGAEIEVLSGAAPVS